MITIIDQQPVPVRVWTGHCEHCQSKFSAHDEDVAQGSGFVGCIAFVLKGGCPVCGFHRVHVGTPGNPFEPYPRPPKKE